MSVKEISCMTVPELKALCKERNIKVKAFYRKPDLIELLLPRDESSVDTTSIELELKAKTVAELKAYAKDKSIKLRPPYNKPNIINIITTCTSSLNIESIETSISSRKPRPKRTVKKSVEKDESVTTTDETPVETNVETPVETPVETTVETTVETPESNETKDTPKFEEIEDENPSVLVEKKVQNIKPVKSTIPEYIEPPVKNTCNHMIKPDRKCMKVITVAGSLYCTTHVKLHPNTE